MNLLFNEPELTILSGTVFDENGSEQTTIYPTLNTPDRYRRNGYRFSAVLQDPFKFVANENELGLMMMIRGRPIPEARPAIGRNGNVYVPTRAARLELSSTIRNLLFAQLCCHPEELRGERTVWMTLIFAYPAGTNLNSVGDFDNLTKFATDAIEAAGIVSNDRQIRGGVIDRVVDHPAGSMTEKLAGTGGYIFILHVNKQEA